ncbi:MAG: DUF882 domain-containing protein [Hyphomicrobium sp.]|nr:DUF882 domain-containing protein [Hyphomicrobium sp.]
MGTSGKNALSLGVGAARLRLGAATLAVLAVFGSAEATGDQRVISLYHIHTKERLEVLYKKNGKYIPEALDKINWILRDWRKNEKTEMDPKTIDIAWEMHAELGSREPIHIISGYRSRSTNNMLRRTVGGQASQSQHITGKAMDIAFPDVPIRRLRYSAMIRERGGVGYYPTSAIPFVHVDSARVRHWPRMTHDELALLFPDGSRHRSSDGRSVEPGDAQRARRRHPDLAQEVALFNDIRSGAKAPTLLASADASIVPAADNEDRAATSDEALPWAGGAQPVKAPEPKLAMRPPKLALASAPLPVEKPVAEPRSDDGTAAAGAAPAAPAPAKSETAKSEPGAPTRQLAALDLSPALIWKASPRAPEPRAPEPRLVKEPKLVERSSTFKPGISAIDRQGLDKLVTLAAYTPLEPAPKLLSEPKLAERPAAGVDETPARESVTRGDSEPPSPPAEAVAELDASEGGGDIGRFSRPAAWITAPEFDEDHPDELAYQPFPIGPLLTATASPDDPALARMVAPDPQRTLDMIDDEGRVLPMRLRPGLKTAKLLWAQEFQGGAVDLATLEQLASEPPRAGGTVAERAVRTSQR